MAGRERDRPSWIRYSSLGVEFVVVVVGFALVGLWVDRHCDSEPWGVLIGAALGLVGGTYNLIRASLAAFRELEKGDRDEKERRSKP